MLSGPRENGRTRIRSRVTNACKRCRKHKIKCSGVFPCENCRNRGARCELGLEDRQVVVAASVLQDLRNRLDEYERAQQVPVAVSYEDQTRSSIAPIPDQPAPAQSNVTATIQPQSQPSDEPESESAMLEDTLFVENGATSQPWSTNVRNPMVPDQPFYMSDGYGQMRYLGHSSTFSLSRQLLLMIHHNPYFGNLASPPVNFDAETYNVENYLGPLSQIDLEGLPSLEVAVFNLQVLRFRTAPLYHLFDEATFTQKLHPFYGNTSTESKIHTDRIWYVHYLLLMAFGKAFTSRSHTNGNVAGIDLFHRALRLLPNMMILWRDPLTTIEIMCCISLYLFSIDYRSSGYVTLGQALRLAQAHGLHTNIQESHLGTHFAARGQRIWWTVYALDRKFSTSMGLPNSLREEDVATPLNAISTTAAESLGVAIHVKICQLLGRVIGTVYSSDGSLSQGFLEAAQEVLRGAGSLADDLTNYSNLCMGDISRVSSHLNLSYHQCIILCTRPVLFHLVKLRLESTNPGRSLPLATPAKGLVQACIDSAVQIATTLSQLMQHELLDAFLPFDIESAFSAGLVIAMVTGIHPKLSPSKNILNSINLIFDNLSQQGNVLAGIRKAEIEELMSVPWNRSRNRQPDSFGTTSDTCGASHISPASSIPLSLGDPFFDQWETLNGLSGSQLISLADALSYPDAADMILN